MSEDDSGNSTEHGSARNQTLWSTLALTEMATDDLSHRDPLTSRESQENASSNVPL